MRQVQACARTDFQHHPSRAADDLLMASPRTQQLKRREGQLASTKRYSAEVRLRRSCRGSPESFYPLLVSILMHRLIVAGSLGERERVTCGQCCVSGDLAPTTSTGGLA